VIRISSASIKPLDAVREEILARMRDQQFERRSQELLDDLARQAYVVEHVPEEAAGYRSVVVGDRDPVRALMRGAPAKSEAKDAPKSEATPPSDAPPASPPPPPAS